MISGKREMMLYGTPQAAPTQNQAGVDLIQRAVVSDSGDDLQDSTPEDISTADFIIMQSSFDCKLIDTHNNVLSM